MVLMVYAKLVKGGKDVFGWSLVSSYGSLRIPEEALMSTVMCREKSWF
jgi:hypothetical protein